MGERGHSLHVLSSDARARLAGLGTRIAILATNDRWTSFVPLDAAAFDDDACSLAADAPVLHVWFDDDHGVVVRVTSSGAFVGELTVPSDLGPADLDFVAEWEELGVLSKVQRAALLRHLDDGDGVRAWAMDHGLERLLGLPAHTPWPSDLDTEALVALLPPEATIVVGRAKARSTKAASASRASSAASALGDPKTTWTDAERATLALHRAYFEDVWAMNNPKLPSIYRKHLPAKERRLVDHLQDAVLEGDVDAIGPKLEAILARIWGSERWDEVIRDPRLEDGDGETWQAFRARL